MSQYVESHFNLCFRVWNVEISVLFVAVWNLTYIKVHARFLTCIPPRVLILVRRLISVAGTQHGVQKHSPVLEASWHIAHG
jgi:hypothetical protein